jgi:parvulin-like peptidyl-prolyl isomerase
MKTSPVRAISAIYATVLALAMALVADGCRRAPSGASLPAEVAARVGDQTITVAALEQELARRRLIQPTEADQAAALEDLIRSEVLYTSALQAAYDKRPEVKAALKRLMVAQYRADLEANRPSPGRVTDEEIAAYYHRHADRYGTPAQVRAALVFLPLSARADVERKAAARRQAEAIRAEALARATTETSFGLLSQTNSAHQASRYKGGDLGWLTQAALEKEWDPALAGAVFALAQPGAITPVLEGRDGLYLFKLMERKPAALKPLAAVRDGVAYQLSREQAAQQEAQLYARLKERVSIRINQTALVRLMTTPPPAAQPPSFSSQ